MPVSARDSGQRRVLMICYGYPPRAGISAIRMGGLARHLPRFGWEPVVLTARPPTTGPRSSARPPARVVETADPGELGVRLKRRLGLSTERRFAEHAGFSVETAARSRLVRRAFLAMKAALAFPDDLAAWGRPALARGVELLEEAGFDAVLSSSSPVTAHLVAKRLARRFDVPWVADLRDLWTLGHEYPYGPLRRLVDRRLELRTLAQASALTTVSQPLAAALGRLHGRPVDAIPNGFDPDDVAPADHPLTSELTITYTGTLLPEVYDPRALLEALEALRRARAPGAAAMKVRFFGPPAPWLAAEVERRGLSAAVSHHGMVDHAEALARQRESQALLLVCWQAPDQAGVYTGKVFEYLAARRPILALGRPGPDVVRDLLAETGAGVYCESAEEVAAVLARWHREHARAGRLTFSGDMGAIARYSHVEMARSFAAVLERVARRAPPY